MRRKYKLFLIIFISVIFAYFIYFSNREDKIRLVALGDGVASGETSYNIDGISYNDYLKEYYDSKNILKGYNTTYTKRNYKLKELMSDVNTNIKDENSNKYIKQIIHKSNILTICMGEDELTKLAITNDLTEEYIKNYLENYDLLLENLTKITDAKIVVIGLYENQYLNKSTVIIINSELSNLVKKHNVIFINIADLLLDETYYLNKNSYYFNYKGHEIISKIIIHSL